MLVGKTQRDQRTATGISSLFVQTLCARLWVVAFLMLAVAACASPVRLPSVPSADTARAMPLGLANARFFPLMNREKFIEEWELSLQRQRQVLGLAPGAQLPVAHFLAVSGGGDNGAFGSGVLIGWTEAGDRPEFQVVTGVSTGALIAPFAFLGPAYDRQLHDVYTTISAEDVFSERGLIGAVFDDALSDTTALWDLISRYVDEPMLEAIAREYQMGRPLPCYLKKHDKSSAIVGTSRLRSKNRFLSSQLVSAISRHP